MHDAGVAEAHFGLGRMDVDVDVLRIDMHEEDDRRMTFEVEGIAGAACGVREDAIFHEAAVDEEELVAARSVAEAARDEPGMVPRV